MPATKEWSQTSQLLQTKGQNHCSEGPGNTLRVDNIIIIKIDDKPSTTHGSIGFMHQNDADSLCDC